MIHLSSAAIAEINRLRSRQADAAQYLRLTVVEGGCSGWSYDLSFTDTPDEHSRVYIDQGLKIVIDDRSATLLAGLSIDYAEDLMGGNFRFNHPQAAKVCSCGLSFALAQEST